MNERLEHETADTADGRRQGKKQQAVGEERKWEELVIEEGHQHQRLHKEGRRLGGAQSPVEGMAERSIV